MKESLLKIENLKMHYRTSEGDVKAIDGISLNIDYGEIVGLVGESGCGKSSLAYTLMRSLSPNGIIKDGRIFLENTEILSMPEKVFRTDIVWKMISLIPQGAMNSLDPLYKVEYQIKETLLAHNFKGDPKPLIDELLKFVDLHPSVLDMYPHQLSGGMKQRITILISMLFKPKLIIADEPTTALDVLTQEHILKLIRKTVKDLGISLILISHDLPIVVENSNKIAIMYAGKIIEYAATDQILKNPKHPYTVGLLYSHPDIESEKEEFVYIPGKPPSLKSNFTGCRFYDRCPIASSICKKEEPKLEEVSPGHYVACHNFDKVIKEIWNHSMKS